MIVSANEAIGSRWSSEFTVTQHQGFQADTMGLDCEGKLIVLAGKRHLGIRRLSESTELLEKLPRNQKYPMTVVEWNPHPYSRQYCAVTTNERVEQLLVREGGIKTLPPLKHHTRQVTGLNWHVFDPFILATASVDSSTLIWDTRDTRRPSLALSSVASVNCVKWNKRCQYLIVTAHDGDLRIWDERKGTLPIQYIAAHGNKIYDIDWSENHESQLSSCSQDCSVKLFDMTNSRRPEIIMQTNGPVWRARYTPWGEGLVSAVVPSGGGETSLLLWNLTSHSGPVHTFVGPLDVLLELHWRRDGAEYQLVTWSRDQTLRIWRIEPFLQRLCGFVDNDVTADTDSDMGAPNSEVPETEIAGLAAPEVFASSLTDSIGAQLMEGRITKTLDDEFDLSEHNSLLPAISFETIDRVNRCCTVRANVNSHQVSLLVSFPPSYPYNAAPSFQIEEWSPADSILKTKLLKVLKQTAQQRVRKNRTCLETCLQQLVSHLELTVQLAEERAPTSRVALGSSPARVTDSTSVYSLYDAYIPYPKSSGARFCSVGSLVCFYRPVRLTARPEPATPRSLSAATSISYGGSFVGSYPRYAGAGSSQDQVDSDLSFFLPERSLSRALTRGSRTVKLPRSVSVDDVLKLFFIHKELAEKYILDLKDVARTCSENAIAAGMVGRADLVQVWALAGLAAKDLEEDEVSWRVHPFSSATINQLIEHYAKASDIQTAAMLSCIFPDPTPKVEVPKPKSAVGSSPYHTIHPADTCSESWYSVPKHHRSNSWSESAEEVSFTIVEHREVQQEPVLKKPRRHGLREELKKRYADILHMWGFLEARTQILKLVDDPVVPHSGLEFLLECQNCNKPVIGVACCSSCRQLALRCAVCRMLVRGASNVCLVCGHGGHVGHMVDWFSTESVCPTGCGCNCALHSSNALES